jgi:nucleotide-binding universal stress UspA family protein
MYQRILLAYDGSREGLIALREGALLARRCNAKVFLLSVLSPVAALTTAEGVYTDMTGEQIAGHKALLQRGVEVARQMGLDPESRLEMGEPAPRIGAVANEIRADLVVVGHRKQNALERWWSGATGAYVSDHVRCSVLIACNGISDEAFQKEVDAAGAQAAPQPVEAG